MPTTCPDGTPGADPSLFLFQVSYYFNWSEADGVVTLAPGSRYNINGTPSADPASSDVPECRVDCSGDLRAYYKDVVEGDGAGDWGDPVSGESCARTGVCCSRAAYLDPSSLEEKFWVDCCIVR